MTTRCNYRCGYCTQRHVEDRSQAARDLPAFLAAFADLPGDWEIKLSGGEPFAHPHFLQAVEGLARAGLRVSVVTNLSAPWERLERFAELTAARPGLLSASLHLGQVEPAHFRDKLAWFGSLFAGSVHATCVATRAVLPMLPELRDAFEAQGLLLEIQPEKQDREVIDYTPAEREALLAMGGHNATGHIAPDLSGRPCWAAARYLIVDHRGDAWPCYPSRRFRTDFLGNLLDGSFRLRLQPRPCPHGYCNCTVPQQRGMVDTRSAPCSLAASS